MKKRSLDNLENINKLKGVVENLDFAQLIHNKKLFDDMMPADLWNGHSWFYMVKGEVSNPGYQKIENYLQGKRNACQYTTLVF